MRKISQDTPFTGDTTTGANGARYVLLNKREEIDEKSKVSYVADGYDIAGVSDVKLFLHQQISDPLYFKVQRGEAIQEDWLETIAKIKTLVI
jgi:hypothetical protein